MLTTLNTFILGKNTPTKSQKSIYPHSTQKSPSIDTNYWFNILISPYVDKKNVNIYKIKNCLRFSLYNKIIEQYEVDINEEDLFIDNKSLELSSDINSDQSRTNINNIRSSNNINSTINSTTNLTTNLTTNTNSTTNLNTSTSTSTNTSTNLTTNSTTNTNLNTSTIIKRDTLIYKLLLKKTQNDELVFNLIKQLCDTFNLTDIPLLIKFINKLLELPNCDYKKIQVMFFKIVDVYQFQFLFREYDKFEECIECDRNESGECGKCDKCNEFKEHMKCKESDKCIECKEFDKCKASGECKEYDKCDKCKECKECKEHIKCKKFTTKNLKNTFKEILEHDFYSFMDCLILNEFCVKDVLIIYNEVGKNKYVDKVFKECYYSGDKVFNECYYSKDKVFSECSNSKCSKDMNNIEDESIKSIEEVENKCKDESIINNNECPNNNNTIKSYTNKNTTTNKKQRQRIKTSNHSINKKQTYFDFIVIQNETIKAQEELKKELVELQNKIEG